ncbi:hypothetical protein BY996DRAFT_3198607 [Phakopsora pachyrhizi]|uniref:Expressed protein n=1 Tax=Phakopsora pachyrhizi TaxID=170000 RepID=A0AAV0B6C8_PHAPC|nr:hypothetical protein BY996DRAFT_3198607 [Phakopsora pachyrhizi]CAH7682557.1 expressed protein [Phakopsora pachyrhizi]
MRPTSYFFTPKRLELIILTLGLFINGNLGTLDFFESSRLNPGSHNIKINDPTPRLNNLINPGFGDGALEIPKKHLKNQESATAPSGLPKFDLNELPYDMDPGNSHGFGGGNFKPESERDYSQTFKRQKIDPAHRSLRPTNLKFPLANVGVESGFEEVASNQAQKINEPGIFREARDYYTNKVSKIQPERNFDHKNGKEHSLIIFKEIFSSSSERDSAGYETKNIKRKVIDELEDQYSVNGMIFIFIAADS